MTQITADTGSNHYDFFAEPEDIEAEAHLLGSLLISSDDVKLAIDKLNISDFYTTGHQYIFKAIKNLYLANEEINLLSVSNWLKDNYFLGDITRSVAMGAKEYLVKLVDTGSMYWMYFKAQLKRVIEKSSARNILKTFHKSTKKIHNNEDLDEALQDVLVEVTKVRSTSVLEDLKAKKEALNEKIKLANEKIDIESIFTKDFGQLLEKRAACIPVPVEYLMQALLPIAAGILGTNHPIQIKEGWTEMPIIWTGIVGYPGDAKSPAIATVLKALIELQRQEHETNLENIKDWQTKVLEWDALTPAEKRQNPDLYPGNEPLPREYYIDNATIEAIRETLCNSQCKNGIVWANDELVGLFEGLNQYKSGKGNDRQSLLTMFNGGAIKTNRVNKRFFVEKSALSIFGSVQPEMLKKIMVGKDDPDGMIGRFLWSNPPAITDGWQGDNFDITEQLIRVFKNLDTLPATTYTLTPAATDLYAVWVNELARLKESGVSDAIKNVLSKLKGYAGRIAVILHCLDSAWNSSVEHSSEIDETVLMRAMDLCTYYLNQAKIMQYTSELPEFSPDLIRIIKEAQKTGKISSQELIARDWGRESKIIKQFNILRDLGFTVIKKTSKELILLVDKVDHIRENNADKEVEIEIKVRLDYQPNSTSQIKEHPKVSNVIDMQSYVDTSDWEPEYPEFVSKIVEEEEEVFIVIEESEQPIDIVLPVVQEESQEVIPNESYNNYSNEPCEEPPSLKSPNQPKYQAGQGFSKNTKLPENPVNKNNLSDQAGEKNEQYDSDL